MRESPAASAANRPAASTRQSDLLRAINTWFADGKAQGWRPRTLDDGGLVEAAPPAVRKTVTYGRPPAATHSA